MMLDISGDGVELLGPLHAHGVTLASALRFEAYADSGADWFARCRKYLASGTSSLPTPIAVFTSNSGWYRHEVLRDLYRAYVEAGLIELAPADPKKSPALEHAIAAGSLDTVKALMDVGADERAIPSPANWIHLDVSDDGEGFVPPPVMKDVHEFIDSVHQDKDIASQLKALMVEHAMKRRIAEQAPGGDGEPVSSMKSDAPSAAPARRRHPL